MQDTSDPTPEPTPRRAQPQWETNASQTQSGSSNESRGLRPQTRRSGTRPTTVKANPSGGPRASQPMNGNARPFYPWSPHYQPPKSTHTLHVFFFDVARAPDVLAGWLATQENDALGQCGAILPDLVRAGETLPGGPLPARHHAVALTLRLLCRGRAATRTATSWSRSARERSTRRLKAT
jgi:hypothetical protein